MKIFHILFLVQGLALLSACATPAGKLKDSDFVSRTIEVQKPVSHTLSSFYEGLRFCGPESGGVVFVTHHGVPECSPMRPDGSAVCDLYMGGGNSGHSSLILGRADFTPTSQGSSITLRVQSYVAGKEKILDAWEKFINGKAKEVCPEN